MKKKGISIKIKMHIFIIVTILFVALGTAAVAFYTSANQIDSYYKRCTVDNAGNFASMVDGDFLARLRRDAESDEYQELRPGIQPVDKAAAGKILTEGNISYHILPSFFSSAERTEPGT